MSPPFLRSTRSRCQTCTVSDLVALTTLSFISSGHAGQTFYVSQAGSDTNVGVTVQHFRQICRAIAIVQPGATMLVTYGNYMGFELFDKVATSNAPIPCNDRFTNAAEMP